jgi:hypothetical protein
MTAPMTKTEMRALYAKAREAGLAAGKGAKPEPMYVVQRADPLDDSSRIVKAYAPVADGPCGFAWVTVKPGNSRFANWLKANGLGHTDHYYGGVSVWVRDFGQSYERKGAYAGAFAKVLSDAGITAYAMDRMD